MLHRKVDGAPRRLADGLRLLERKLRVVCPGITAKRWITAVFEHHEKLQTCGRDSPGFNAADPFARF